MGASERPGAGPAGGAGDRSRPPPVVAVAPAGDDGVLHALVEGGGRPGPPDVADAVIWTAHGDAPALRDLLAISPARWVHTVCAGVETIVAAGLVDETRTWTSAKVVHGQACAEHALALILAAGRRLHRRIRAAGWEQPGPGTPERSLREATVLVVGTGGIGASLVPMLRALGARVLAVNRSGRPLPAAERTEPVRALGELVPEADFVVLAAPLTPETERLFDHAMLDRMKPGAWLVNVSRGGLVDTAALTRVLLAGRLGGAALDVTDPEPLPDGHPLWSLDDVIITPHRALCSGLAARAGQELISRNVRRFIEGRPLEGLLDPTLGY